MLLGAATASVFFPVGEISNAANENQTEPTSSPATQITTPVQTNGQNPLTNAASSHPGTPGTISSQPTPDSSTPPAAPEANPAAPSATTPAPATVALKLVLDGKGSTLTALPGQNLKQALAAAGVVLEELDRVWPHPQTAVRDGLAVKVETVRDRLETREEPVAPGFRIQLTTKIRPGVQQVVNPGRAGAVEVTERVVSVGGRRVRTSPISRQLIRPATDKVIALGSDGRFMPHTVPYHKRYARAYQAERTLSARGGSARARFEVQTAPQTATLRPIKSFMAHTSAYAAGPAGGSIGNYTATGMRCVRGAVAVDPRVIPLGTKLYIEGYGYGFACDTGSAIKGKRIDLAFNSVRECFQHGRRVNKVWILSN